MSSRGRTSRLGVGLTCGLLGATVGVALPLIAVVMPTASWVAAPLVITDVVRPVDAIVVLGAGAYDETTLTPESAYRLILGVQLLKEGHGRIMVLSGGSHRGTRVSDARVMGRVAERLGIGGEAVVLDESPTATWQQARSVAGIAQARGLHSIAVVTSPLHSYRAVHTFRQAGLEALSVPAGPGLEPRLLTVGKDHVAGRLEILVQALYEHVAIAAYRLRGRL